jgi:hypothetical protein
MSECGRYLEIVRAVEPLSVAATIAVSAEAAQDYKKLLSDRTKLVETSLVNAIGISQQFHQITLLHLYHHRLRWQRH